jgi:hypothetical protein
MRDVTASEQLFEPEHGRFERASRLLNPIRQGAFGKMASQEIRPQFLDALHGQQLKVGEIDGKRSHPWSILRGCIDTNGKMSGGHMLAGWAANRFHAMFDHPQTEVGQFMDLPTLTDRPGTLAQLVMTGFTVLWSVCDHLIRQLHWLQRMLYEVRTSSVGQSPHIVNA